MTKRYDFERFAAVNNYSPAVFSPDGTQVAYVSNVSGQRNLWRQAVRLSDSGSPLAPRQLTNLVEQGASQFTWSPDGASLLMLADMHGDENYQVFRVSAEHGWPEAVTNQPDVRHGFGGDPFSPDGTKMLISSNARSAGDIDVLLFDVATGEQTSLVADGGMQFAGDWSPDGSMVPVVDFKGNTHHILFVLNMATGERIPVTQPDEAFEFEPHDWLDDNSGFYVITNRGRDFVGLAFFDIASRELSWVETPDWDVESVTLSADSRYLAWTVNEDGYSILYIRDLTSGELIDTPALPSGVYSGLSFSPTEPLLSVHITRSSQPGNLYFCDLSSGAQWSLTNSFLGGIDSAELVEPTLIRFPTHDDRDVPAFLYKPLNAKPGERYPIVLSIHGGPEAQERPTYNYNGLYQYWLSRGIGVLAPNIRGSTGYGLAYQQMIYRDWGGAELEDLRHAAIYMQGLDWVDVNRIGVFGGSFGGFATLSCISRLPQYFHAAVDLVGPSNLVTFAKSVPPHWRHIIRQWVGDPEDDYDMLMERSPITYVGNIEAPLLIIQGGKDPRVVQAESDQIVQKLKSMGRDVDYLLFEDEGHGFAKTANLLKALRASGEWFVKHFDCEL